MSAPNVFGADGDAVLAAAAIDFVRDLQDRVSGGSLAPSDGESECHSTHPVGSPDVKQMGAVTISRNGYVEKLEQELTDTRKLLATYSAEREHNAMLALRYEAAIKSAMNRIKFESDAWFILRDGLRPTTPTP